MFTKTERTIRGLEFSLNPTREGAVYSDSYEVSKGDRHVASVRLADGLLVVKYPPESSGDLYQEMPPFARDQFRDELSRSDSLDRCAMAIRARMFSDGTLQVDEVFSDEMSGKVIKEICDDWITSIDGFRCAR